MSSRAVQAVRLYRAAGTTLIKEIIIDKKKLHLYNEYTEVSYES